MTLKLLASGVTAGFAAGLFAALLHFAFIQTIIVESELYETGEVVHWGGLAPASEAPAHSEGEDHGSDVSAEVVQDSHEHGGGGDASSISRNLLTVLFTGLIYAGYGLIMVAAMQLAAMRGIAISLKDGVLWGIAGFVSFQMAPAMGLAPELPGTVAADLVSRQIWWWATVVATAGSIALIAYGRNMLAYVAGFVLLSLPHVIGAPHIEGYWGYAPPELGSTFSARVLGVGLLVWAVLGWLIVRLGGAKHETA